MLARTYKYRLYPTAAQEQTLKAWQLACWQVQKLCVIERRQHRAYVQRCKRRGIEPAIKPPSQPSQGRAVTELRALYPDLAFVPADVMGEIPRRVDAAQKRAIKQAKETGKFNQIRWVDKPEHIGLTFRGQPDRGTQMVGQRGRFSYWKMAGAGRLGIVKIRQHRPIPQGADIRQVHVTKNALGWFISFACFLPDVPPAPLVEKEINGVDIGCIHEGDQQRIAVVDDGRIFRTTDNLKRTAKHLAHLQTMVNNRRVHKNAKHANPNSKRTAKRHARIAKLHGRIARQRDHVLHYTARRLVDTANVTAFEDLNHTAMRRKGKGNRKRGLNRSLASAAPGRLIALTTEKSTPIGRAVVKVNARNTSQICSTCGVLPEQKKNLNIRTWRCAACGTTHDRDINAARNIAARATNDSGTFSAGVPGEGALVIDHKRRSMNLEATAVAGGENTASTSDPSAHNIRRMQPQRTATKKRTLQHTSAWRQEQMFE